MVGLFKIFDSHVHFYSHSFFRFLITQKSERTDRATELKKIATKGKIEIPGEDPLLLAKRWIDIIDKWKIERLVLIASIPGDEDSVLKAVTAYPQRFTPFFTIEPNSNLMLENATARLKEQKFRGILLYPALYQINVQDLWLEPLYELANSERAIIVTQFGSLPLKAREYAGIDNIYSEEYSNPQDLIPVAKKYPDISFIIPSFGAGRFLEVLEAGKECSNLFVNTSGSNLWLQDNPEKLDLRQVFSKTLNVFGADRIVFGSDSGFLPRGYRYDILDNQIKTLQEMRIQTCDLKKIFYDNLEGLIAKN